MAYPVINAILVENRADICAAEAHGLATGLLCANENTDSDYWLNELLHNAPATVDEQPQPLVRLFEETRQLLAGDEFAFDLFLPDDDAPFENKLRHYAAGVRGFYSAWVINGPNPTSQKKPMRLSKILLNLPS